ncbi:uncharacterized protein LOC129314807 [Prosopis cineraria]|uniref:uncharacterized protein LOC129314807 n=1 Tax=Prosopis cineraria TaxID=364024 RepID=UPI00241070A2|nr:uncharacterized protein LOC129314807 [Prosopis cineraria]
MDKDAVFDAEDVLDEIDHEAFKRLVEAEIESKTSAIGKALILLLNISDSSDIPLILFKWKGSIGGSMLVHLNRLTRERNKRKSLNLEPEKGQNRVESGLMYSRGNESSASSEKDANGRRQCQAPLML